MRLTWAQPEDLLPHELVQSQDEGRNIDTWAQRWTAAGGDITPAVSGASATPASPRMRALARELLDEIDASSNSDSEAEPNEWDEILSLIDVLSLIHI